jgi:dienelactone hydrolase
VVVVHDIFGLNDNIKGICRRLASEGYAALGVDLFAGRNRPVCIARMFLGWGTGRLEFVGVRDLRVALEELAQRPEVDSKRLGAVGFCLGGMYVITWACTDNRLKAIAPYYGTAPPATRGDPAHVLGGRFLARQRLHDERCRLLPRTSHARVHVSIPMAATVDRRQSGQGPPSPWSRSFFSSVCPSEVHPLCIFLSFADIRARSPSSDSTGTPADSGQT